MLESYLIPYEAQQRINAQHGVLVIAPHPDDEVFGCAGAIAQHLIEKIPVTVIVLSDGQAQGEGEQRRAESNAAAQLLGYGAPIFWGLTDREILYSESLVTRLMAFMDTHNIDLIYCPSPLELHPDHRQAALIVIETARRLSGLYKVAFYEISAPLHPNVLLDISAHLALKKAAMQCFASQQSKQSYSDHINALNRYRTYTLPQNIQAAEAFLVLDAKALDQISAPVFARPLVEKSQPKLVTIMIRSMDRPWLAQALDSVALQDYPHIAVLVIAAIPSHQLLPNRCGSYPLQLLGTDIPLDRAAAANRALDYATGHYLLFLDDDDWLLPDHISRLVNALEKGSALYRAAYSGVALVDLNNCPTGGIFDYPFDSIQLAGVNITPIHAVLFDRSLIAQGCRFDEKLAHYEDWDFWLQITRCTLMAHLPGVSAAYRIHESSGIHTEATQIASQRVHEKWQVILNDSELSQLMKRLCRYSELLKENLEFTAACAEQDRVIQEFTAACAEQDRVIQEFTVACAEQDRVIQDLNSEKNEILGSRSWRITAPLRKMSTVGRKMPMLIRLVKHPTHLYYLFKRAWSIFRSTGMAGVVQAIKKKSELITQQQLSYQEWINNNEISTAQYPVLLQQIETWNIKPLISVLMPTYNTDPSMLRAAIQSVIDQIYPFWELCISDDYSTNPEIIKIIKAFAQIEPRIKWSARPENGHISAASNSALAIAHGEFIALLDHDDLLHPLALWHVAHTLQAHPNAGLLYSDEDKLNENGERCEPYFKCDFNPELMLAQNMVSHLGCYRTSLVEQVGGFRADFEGSQDYDLALRVIDLLPSTKIVHIPHILYHWRMLPGSTALHPNEKSYAQAAAMRAIEEHLVRKGLVAEVLACPEAPHYQRVRFQYPSPAPKVSIIIPTRDRADLLEKCISSILTYTTYPDFQIIVIDNDSQEPKTHKLFARLEKLGVRLVHDPRTFNYSALNNHAAQLADGEYLCLLNNDIEIVTPDWLEEMMGFAAQSDIGAVGARLWYPDGTVQHAGIIIGLGGVAGHTFLHQRKGDMGYFGRAVVHQSYSAVTGACLLVRKSLFMELGGLDESLAVAFNDVDFCLRLQAAGYRNVWTPYAQMIHHESASRGLEDSEEKQARFQGEIKIMQSRWSQIMAADPAYSPNLSLFHAAFTVLAESVRTTKSKP